MDYRNGTSWHLRGMEEAEGVRHKGVHPRMERDPSDAFERADKEGVLAEVRAGTVRFDVPFPEAGIRLLDQGDLFGREFDGVLAVSFLQVQKAFVPGSHTVIGEDLLDGDMAAGPGPHRAPEDSLCDCIPRLDGPDSGRGSDRRPRETWSGGACGARSTGLSTQRNRASEIVASTRRNC